MTSTIPSTLPTPVHHSNIWSKFQLRKRTKPIITQPISPITTQPNSPSINRISSYQINEKHSKNEKPRGCLDQSKKWSLWLIYCRLVTLPLVKPLLVKLGYNSEDRRWLFREKVGYVITYLLTNIVVAGLMVYSLIYACNTSNKIQSVAYSSSSQLNLTQRDILVRGKFYSAKSIGLDPNDSPFGLNLSNLIVDTSFYFQSRSQYCDEFWGASGKGTYLPCYPINLINSTIFSLHEDQKLQYSLDPLAFPCMWSTDQQTSFLNDKANIKGKLVFNYKDLNQNRYWISYKNKILDLSRLRYLHPKLVKGQVIWFTKFADQLHSQLTLSQTTTSSSGGMINKDFDYFIANGLTRDKLEQFDKCVADQLMIGELESIPFMCWMPAALISCFLVAMLSLLLLMMLTVWLFNIMRKAIGFYKDGSRKDKTHLPISKSYFYTQYNSQKSTRKSNSWFEAVKKRMALDIRALEIELIREGGYPNTVQFKDQELNRGIHHLAQTEPDYELIDHLDFDPARTIITIPANQHTDIVGLRESIQSCAETRYPATHKLIVVVIDGCSDKLSSDILGLLVDEVIPKHLVKGSSYLAEGEGLYQHNVAQCYAGYYQYLNPDVLYHTNKPIASTDIRSSNTTTNSFLNQHSGQSHTLKVPFLIINKVGNPEEKHMNPKFKGMRGQKDSVQLVLSFLQRIFFNLPMCALDYDMLTLIKAITGVSPEHFSILVTVGPGSRLSGTALIDLVRPLIQFPNIHIVTCPLSFDGKGWANTITRITKSFIFNVINRFTFIGQPYLVPRQCVAYRIWSAPKSVMSFQDLRLSLPSSPEQTTQPILIHPDILQAYTRASPQTFLNPRYPHLKEQLFTQWCEDGELTNLMRKFDYGSVTLPKSVCAIPLPSSFNHWLRYTVVEYLNHLTHAHKTLSNLSTIWWIKILSFFIVTLLWFTPLSLCLFIVALYNSIIYPNPFIFPIFPLIICLMGVMYLLFLLAGSFSQSNMTFLQKLEGFIVGLVAMPLVWLVIPIVSISNCDEIASKSYLSSNEPNYTLVKRPNTALSQPETSQAYPLASTSTAPTLTRKSKLDSKLFVGSDTNSWDSNRNRLNQDPMRSDLSSSTLKPSDSNQHNIFVKRFREEMDHYLNPSPAITPTPGPLPSSSTHSPVIAIGPNHLPLSPSTRMSHNNNESELAMRIPMRYYLDWVKMQTYFQPEDQTSFTRRFTLQSPKHHPRAISPVHRDPVYQSKAIAELLMDTDTLSIGPKNQALEPSTSSSPSAIPNKQAQEVGHQTKISNTQIREAEPIDTNFVEIDLTKAYSDLETDDEDQSSQNGLDTSDPVNAYSTYESDTPYLSKAKKDYI